MELGMVPVIPRKEPEDSLAIRRSARINMELGEPALPMMPQDGSRILRTDFGNGWEMACKLYDARTVDLENFPGYIQKCSGHHVVFSKDMDMGRLFGVRYLVTFTDTDNEHKQDPAQFEFTIDVYECRKGKSIDKLNYIVILESNRRIWPEHENRLLNLSKRSTDLVDRNYGPDIISYRQAENAYRFIDSAYPGGKDYVPEKQQGKIPGWIQRISACI